MNTRRLFISNKSQAVRIPKKLAFDSDVKEVSITQQGNSLLITPVTQHWDDFFSRPPCPDFMADGRDQPDEQVRESFDD